MKTFLFIFFMIILITFKKVISYAKKNKGTIDLPKVNEESIDLGVLQIALELLFWFLMISLYLFFTEMISTLENKLSIIDNLFITLNLLR